MRKCGFAKNSSLEEMARELRGKAVWSQVAKRDWPIYSNIYADQVVQIGGYTGNLAKRILDSQIEIRNMHVYEPDPKFCTASQDLLRKYVETGVVTVFNEAVHKSDGKDKLLSAGDWSTLKKTSRNIESEGFEISEIEVVTASVQTVIDRLDSLRDFTLVMNCEGSEYLIIEDILNSKKLPATVISQMHTVGENPIKTLYEIRSKLAEKFTPVICCDWAWDIWVRNDLSPISAEKSERLRE
jgi:FkbM family methyltransferase